MTAPATARTREGAVSRAHAVLHDGLAVDRAARKDAKVALLRLDRALGAYEALRDIDDAPELLGGALDLAAQDAEEAAEDVRRALALAGRGKQ